MHLLRGAANDQETRWKVEVAAELPDDRARAAAVEFHVDGRRDPSRRRLVTGPQTVDGARTTDDGLKIARDSDEHVVDRLVGRCRDEHPQRPATLLSFEDRSCDDRPHRAALA